MKKIVALSFLSFFLMIAFTGCGQSAEEKAKMELRDAKRISDVKQIITSLELYENDNKSFPQSLNELEKTSYGRNIQLLDPSKSFYEYKFVSDNNFEICTVLEVGAGQFEKGKVCHDKEKFYQK